MIRKPVGLTAPYREDDDDIQTYKKPWASLTEEEIHKCIAYAVGGCDIEQTFRNIEARLKELNHD